MRAPRSLAALALLWVVPAWAAEAVLKNDTFTGAGTVATPVAFPTYYGVGAVFEADAGEYPLTLTAIDVFCAPAPNGGTSGALGAWLLDVWDETADAGILPPMKISGNRHSSGVQLTASLTQLNRFPFPQPIVIARGKFFVAVREQQSSADDGTTIAMDTGPLKPGANWWFSPNAPQWTPMTGVPDAGAPRNLDRNWIVRAVLSVPDTGAGGGAGGAGGSGGGAGAGAGGSGGAGNLALRLDSVDPAEIWTGDETVLTVRGAAFDLDVQFLIGSRLVTTVERRSGSVLSVTIKARSLTVGAHDVTVINTDGSDATLIGALTVRDGSGPGAGCSCGSAPGLGLAVALLALGLSGRRRHRRLKAAGERLGAAR